MKHRICILIGRLHKRTNKHLLQGMLMQLKVMGCMPVVFTMGDDNSNEKIFQGNINLCRLIPFGQFDGVIYAPYTFSTKDYYEYIDRFLAEQCPIPVVRIGIEKLFTSVWYDDRYEMKKLTAHLIEAHHCKTIDCLTGPESLEVSHSRLAGYRDAMQAAGLAISPENEIFGDFWTIAAQQLAADIHSGNHPKPDAVCCANDVMAITLCDALKEYGIAVPEEILVTGYVGYTEARLHIPAITTYQTSQERLGIKSVCTLYSIVQNAPIAPCADAEGLLCCRESCGCSSQNEPFDKKKFNYRQFETDFLNSSVSGTLYNVSSMNELRRQVFRHLFFFMEDERWRKEAFYLCLCEDWDNVTITHDREQYRTDGYADNMILYGVTERITYPTSELLPEGYLQTKEDDVLIISPAHFLNRCFGYYAMKIGTHMDSFNLNFLYFIRELNHVLEFLAVQSNLKRLSYLQQMTELRDTLTGLYKLQESETILKEMLQQAECSGKLLYLVGLRIQNQNAYRDDFGVVSYEHCLVTLSDQVKSCCVHQEQVFLMESDTLLLIGQESTQQLHHDSCEKRLLERFKSLREKNANFPEIAVSATLIIPEMQLLKENLKRIDERLSMAKKPLHYREIVAIHAAIYCEPEKHWTNERCAAQIGLTPAHFGQIYKFIIGESCQVDIRRSRIQYAKLLLLTTDYTIDTIAEACGYDRSHFMRSFKAETGVTPAHFKDTCRREHEENAP